MDLTELYKKGLIPDLSSGAILKIIRDSEGLKSENEKLRHENGLLKEKIERLKEKKEDLREKISELEHKIDNPYDPKVCLCCGYRGRCVLVNGGRCDSCM